MREVPFTPDRVKAALVAAYEGKGRDKLADRIESERVA
jgi:hypothetical protein